MRILCQMIIASRITVCLCTQPTWKAYINDQPFPKWPSESALPGGKKVLHVGYLTSAGSVPTLSSIDTLPFGNHIGRIISGAMSLAVSEINNRSDLLPHHILQFSFADTYGFEELSIQYTSRLLQEESISAIIGPQDTCITEASMAHSYNKLMISYYCTQHEVSNKPRYSTFVRTRSSDSSAANSVVAMLIAYGWKKVALVHRRSSNVDPVYQQYDNVYKATIKVLADFNISVTADKSFEKVFYGFPESAKGFERHNGEFGSDSILSEFDQIIKDTHQLTRIYVIIGRSSDVVPFMTVMGEKDLLSSGNYFVIGVDPMDPYDPLNPVHYILGEVYSGIPPELYSYYQSAALILRASPLNNNLKEFAEAVRKYNQLEPFRFRDTLSRVMATSIQAAIQLYDAVYAYAYAVNRTLPDNATSPDVLDGKVLAKQLIGATYISKSGHLAKIDDNGDAEGTYGLFYRSNIKTLDPKTNKFGLYPAADFLIRRGVLLPELIPRSKRNLTFLHGVAPKDEPECGFRQEKCTQTRSEPIWKAVVGALVGLFVVLAVIAVACVRKRKLYEEDLRSLIWRISRKDIVMNANNPCGIRMSRLASLVKDGGSYSETHWSVNSVLASSRASQSGIQMAFYRGLPVSLKRLRKNSVVITRDIQKELKLMRDVRHDNLTAFIGACIEPGNVFIVLEYCSKGSLFDILENSEVKLDSMFINSFLNDIIKGMTFLHDSELHYHGNLRSSNCLIDSRWVLKLSGYGLHEFKAGESEEQITENQRYLKLLWTAPELLRLPHANQVHLDLQKADVYSFAIIAYELCGRNGPFGDHHANNSNKAIVTRVRDGWTFGIFRPKLAALSNFPKCLTECIQDCWSEFPSLRPTFRTIHDRLKPIQKGMKGNNILDNIISMMEKYTSNLESIVQERTEQLFEEKRKTEELLYQMLPRSVVEQLKRGKQVEAEAFDSVTIYFSDICGFTFLSSESTPMEIVTLLNDLYTVFDEIIGNYDVYKVETIGDAYMVASGLPRRNGINHAGEIASMSLHLLSALEKFKIRHRPNETLKLRIGIHSGPCVAGVVGLKMPRYCLFGDTVNTASRLESTGQALRIHCSQASKLLLDKLGGYVMEERGLVEMKGKGELLTYWLLREDAAVRQRRLIYRRDITDLPSTPQHGSSEAICHSSPMQLSLPSPEMTPPVQAQDIRPNLTIPSRTSSCAVEQPSEAVGYWFSIKRLAREAYLHAKHLVCSSDKQPTRQTLVDDPLPVLQKSAMSRRFMPGQRSFANDTESPLL